MEGLCSAFALAASSAALTRYLWAGVIAVALSRDFESKARLSLIIRKHLFRGEKHFTLLSRRTRGLQGDKVRGLLQSHLFQGRRFTLSGQRLSFRHPLSEFP